MKTVKHYAFYYSIFTLRDYQAGMNSRKSTRVRQKRSLGEDFVDPNSVDPLEFIAKFKSPSPTVSTQEAGPSSSYDETIDAVASNSSTLLKHIADGIKHIADGIYEIKTEAPEEPKTSYASYAREIVKNPRRKDPEKEKNLEEAAADAVARIREANAMKILEKRVMGKVSKGSQIACQDAELKNYLAGRNVEAEQQRYSNQEEVLKKEIKKEVEDEPSTSTPVEPPKKVVRVLVTRGPNGEIVPKGRFVVKSAQYVRRVTLAPPSGVGPPVLQPGVSGSRPPTINGYSINGPQFAIKNFMKAPEPPKEIRPTVTHPGSLVDIKPVKVEEVETPVIKEEPFYVKEEPMDDYEPPPISSAPLPLQYPPRKPKIIVPVHAQRHLYDLVVKGNRGMSPHRVFLGAHEPMKDMTPDSYGQYTIRRVKSLNFKWDDRKFTPLNLDDGGMKKVQNPKKKEESEEEKEIKRKRNEEFIRQKRAKTQKQVRNEIQVWEYMQSGEFQKTLEPGSSEFEKIVNKPNPLAEIPQFSDSLCHTNPVLFQNLLDIYQMKHEQHDKKNTKPPKPRRPDIDIDPEEFQCGESRQINPEHVEVEWDGIKTMIPELTPCHLCSDMMRLCIRKTYYKGTLRSYPAYRCLRKGCQTFRSVKKQFLFSLRYGCGTETYKPKPAVVKDNEDVTYQLARCEETIDDEAQPSAPPMKREKRIRKSHLDEENEDFFCGTTPEEIARKEEEEEEDEELTVGYEHDSEDSIESAFEEERIEEDNLEDEVTVEDPDI
uniref:DUF4774 domain-containing protein n=1 Tax=Caenorhabditis tropicalis TaxID=1561998 RepID=A0A1I7UGP8_9PELO